MKILGEAITSIVELGTDRERDRHPGLAWCPERARVLGPVGEPQAQVSGQASCLAPREALLGSCAGRGGFAGRSVESRSQQSRNSIERVALRVCVDLVLRADMS